MVTIKQMNSWRQLLASSETSVSDRGEACLGLGIAYYDGHEGSRTRSYELAHDFFKEALGCGVKSAAYYLGILHLYRQCIGANDADAIHYLQVATMHGHKEAAQYLTEMMEYQRTRVVS